MKTCILVLKPSFGLIELVFKHLDMSIDFSPLIFILGTETLIPRSLRMFANGKVQMVNAVVVASCMDPENIKLFAIDLQRSEGIV